MREKGAEVPSGGDRGQQAERTRLAWRRTTLAATVVALLGVSRVLSGGIRLTEVAGAALSTLAWLAIVVVAHQRIGALTAPSTADGADASLRPAHRAPAALALLAAAMALLGLLLIG